MWTCPKCGESVDDQFDSCWKCAAPPEKSAPRPLFSRGAKRYLFFGIVFELGLLVLCLLPTETWLPGQARNFTLITHFPLILLLDGLGLDGTRVTAILGLLIGLVIMASLWGFLIYLLTRLVKRVLAAFVVAPNQKRLLGYSAGFLGAAVLAWAIVANWPATPRPFTASPEVKAAVAGNTAFALDLYQKLRVRPGNLFFSPYSISASLAMTYAGARGPTETEMAKVLHFNSAPTNLHAAFGVLTERLNRIQRWNRITLQTANSLWCQQDYRFTDAFLKLVHEGYRAEARPVDFKQSPQVAGNKINRWTEQKTKGKIKGILEPDQLASDVRLVLCNAIYFKGKWQHQFKARDTKPGPFHVTTNETVTVPMMSRKARFKTAYSDYRSVGLLELPYTGTDLSMIILLPEVGYPLPDVEQPGLPDLEPKLTADNLRAWLAALDRANPHETWVALPRFTTTQSFDLAKELKSLGMPSAFNETADFSGMEATTNLFLTDVRHKAFVEVNESGTEAAAVTLTTARTKGGPGRFIVDHPFVFLIRENGSGSILFIGRIVDPTQ
jgi:serine protease inhibitor